MTRLATAKKKSLKKQPAVRRKTKPVKKAPAVEFQGSRLFGKWLSSVNASLAFTTYQAGKLIFVGADENQQLSVFDRTFPRSMGLAQEGSALWMASETQLWRFEDFLSDEAAPGNCYDALYVPINAHTTGDIDIHDVGVMACRQPVFVATAFNCLATIEENSSFTPVWKPPFIDRIAAEDRCHLNGLAMDKGQPKYVTAVSQSNIAEGWREHRVNGGVVIDVETSEIVATELSMPHSPRLYNGVLWLLNAGTGEFGKVDLKTGLFEPLAFCPGFLRGLAFVDEYAIVGLSKLRNNKTFSGLPISERLKKDGVGDQCGLKVIHLKTGDVAHSFTINGAIHELYDVLAVSGIKKPAALGFKSTEINTLIKIGDGSGFIARARSIDDPTPLNAATNKETIGCILG